MTSAVRTVATTGIKTVIGKGRVDGASIRIRTTIAREESKEAAASRAGTRATMVKAVTRKTTAAGETSSRAIMAKEIIAKATHHHAVDVIRAAGAVNVPATPARTKERNVASMIPVTRKAAKAATKKVATKKVAISKVVTSGVATAAGMIAGKVNMGRTSAAISSPVIRDHPGIKVTHGVCKGATRVANHTADGDRRTINARTTGFAKTSAIACQTIMMLMPPTSTFPFPIARSHYPVRSIPNKRNAARRIARIPAPASSTSRTICV